MIAATLPIRPSTRQSRTLATVAAVCLGGLASSGYQPSLAQSVPAQSAMDTENGRYSLSPTADGVVRLDTRTGIVSTCGDRGTGWACYAVPDERAALDGEIGRLQKENDRLKAELAQREPTVAGKTDAPLPKADSLKPSDPKTAEAERKLEIPLPSDRDMDRMMSFVERAWHRLVEMANRMQKDVSGRI